MILLRQRPYTPPKKKTHFPHDPLNYSTPSWNCIHRKNWDNGKLPSIKIRKTNFRSSVAWISKPIGMRSSLLPRGAAQALNNYANQLRGGHGDRQMPRRAGAKKTRNQTSDRCTSVRRGSSPPRQQPLYTYMYIYIYTRTAGSRVPSTLWRLIRAARALYYISISISRTRTGLPAHFPSSTFIHFGRYDERICIRARELARLTRGRANVELVYIHALPCALSSIIQYIVRAGDSTLKRPSAIARGYSDTCACVCTRVQKT